MMGLRKIINIIINIFKYDTVKIVKLECTCQACPTQYEAKLEDGRLVYLRYRWGYLSIRASPCETDNIHDAISGEEVLGESRGDDFHGSMDRDEVISYLRKAGFDYEEDRSILG